VKVVLLDENLPHTLRRHLGYHKTTTAAYAGFAGYKNGALLDAAEAAGFDVLITGDRTLHYEQNLSGRKIAIVSLSAVSWPIIEPYVGKIAAAVDSATSGSFTRIECGKFVRLGRGLKGPTP
jgi:hypothetical protein